MDNLLAAGAQGHPEALCPACRQQANLGMGLRAMQASKVVLMTRLTNGETMEVTEAMYNAAPRIYKWCLKCHKCTEHLKLWAPMIQRNVIVCNAFAHKVKLVYGEEDNG